MGPMLDIHGLCLMFMLFMSLIWGKYFISHSYLGLSLKIFYLIFKKRISGVKSQRMQYFKVASDDLADQTYSVSSGLSLTLGIILRQKPDHSNLQQYS